MRTVPNFAPVARKILHLFHVHPTLDLFKYLAKYGKLLYSVSYLILIDTELKSNLIGLNPIVLVNC